MTVPFCAKDCNLSIIATGRVASSLVELRDLLYQVPIGSLYYHFWGGSLRISFVHPEYHNDFCSWAHFGLHDDVLTERLSIIDPTEFEDLEALRKKVIDVIEDRLDEIEYYSWSREEHRFHFLRSITIVYDLNLKTTAPPDLKNFILKMPFTSIFYHFIDARRRTPNQSDDFSAWLSGFGTQFDELIKEIKKIDPFFLSLSEIRDRLTELFNQYL